MRIKKQLAAMEERLRQMEELINRTHYVATEGATWTHPARNHALDQLGQHLARLEWQRRLLSGEPLPTFDEVQFRAFSQNGEDGIIWYLFSLIGDGTKRVAEVCAGDSIECCSANLVVNHGWQGLLFEGNQDRVERGRWYYTHSRDAWYAPPTIVQGWVTAETIAEQLTEHDFDHDLDLLIIDVDGNDFWLWKAIEIRPRVVVVEVNPTLGPEESVAIPYDPEWVWEQGSAYHSASLRAFNELAAKKGYRLVGVERYNFNAFFVRNDCGVDALPEVSVDSCFTHHTVKEAMKSRQELLTQFAWVHDPASDSPIA